MQIAAWNDIFFTVHNTEIEKNSEFMQIFFHVQIKLVNSVVSISSILSFFA